MIESNYEGGILMGRFLQSTTLALKIKVEDDITSLW